MNVIAPDNQEKKFLELRKFLFPGLMTKEECKKEGVDFDPEVHQLKTIVDEDTNEKCLENQ